MIVCVHMSPPNLSSFLTCGPVSLTLVQPRLAVAGRRASARASEQIESSEPDCAPSGLLPLCRIEWLASSVYSPFALLIRGSFAASSPIQAMQRNRIAIAFPPPIIAHCTGFCTSPVLLLLLRICLAVKRIAVLFRSSFGSFRREGQPVPRHAAITRLSHARPFSTPHEHPRP